MRARAILLALKYGLLPWRCYEADKHHDGGYLAHVALNLAHAARWATFRETEQDREFERIVNGAPPPVRLQGIWRRDFHSG